MRRLFLAAVFLCGCVRPWATPSAPQPTAPAPAGAAGDEHAAEAPPSAATTEPTASEPDEESDDAAEGSAPTIGRTVVVELSDQEIQDRLHRDPVSLGSMSVGATNAGALFNGVQLAPGERWEIVDPSHVWGTQETIDFLGRAVDKVHQQFPDAPKLNIGHISAKGGGHLSPHRSHQAGRDADVGYFYSKPAHWFERATQANLDLPRTWAFVRALITETDVEMILIDSSIQKLLKDYAAQHGEDPAWLDDVFQIGSRQLHPIIRHIKGHATHLHVRFFSPRAQELARRAQRFMPQYAHARVAPVASESFIEHKARKGDTLGALARRYGTSVEAIERANGLKSNHIHEKAVYRIPRAGAPAQGASTPTFIVAAASPIVIPPRRLPPRHGAGIGASSAGPQL